MFCSGDNLTKSRLRQFRTVICPFVESTRRKWNEDPVKQNGKRLRRRAHTEAFEGRMTQLVGHRMSYLRVDHAFINEIQSVSFHLSAECIDFVEKFRFTLSALTAPLSRTPLLNSGRNEAKHKKGA